MAILKSENGKYYVVVEQGDTLSQIALDYKDKTGGASYQSIAYWNGINNPNLIYINQKIYLQKDTALANTKSIPQPQDRVYLRDGGVQMLNDGTDTLFLAWTFGKNSSVKHYKVSWQCYDANGRGYGVVNSEATGLYNTYKIPDEIKKQVRKVKVSIVPVAKDGVKMNVASVSSTYNGGALPSTPSGLSASLDGAILSAIVRNVSDDSTHVVFQYAKNNVVEKETKVAVKTGEASTKWTVALGNTYKVRCCGYNNKVKGPWSDWSENFETVPAAPTITKCEPSTGETGETCIKLEWDSIANATGYKIRYATAKEDFDISGKYTDITPEKLTTLYFVKGDIKTETTYYFRVKAINAKGEGEWSSDTDGSSTMIADTPAPPTTWSSASIAQTTDYSITLYWAHNSTDNSLEKAAWLNIWVDGELLDGTTKNIHKPTSDAEKGITSRYELILQHEDGVPKYRDGAKIEWNVSTEGASGNPGEWSQINVIDLYAPADLTLLVKSSEGTLLSNDESERLTSFPFTIEAFVSDALVNQKPISYYVQILPMVDPDLTYETVDDTGSSIILAPGIPVYERNFSLSEGETTLSEELSAGDVRLESGMSYIVTCVVSMDSGLTDEVSREFAVFWEGSSISPGLDVEVDPDTYSASLSPYCSELSVEYRKVNRVGNAYIVTETVLEVATGDPVMGAVTTTGEQVWHGFVGDNVQSYYCIDTKETIINDVILSIFRREYDGTFTKIADNIDSAVRTTVVDPHPALDYARYRVVATFKDTGAVTYYDTPEYPVGGTEIVLQWDEPWSSIYADPDQPFTSSSMLKFPYNIDSSPKSNRDVSLVKYIGRANPVSYYGTQRGEGGSYNAVIRADDGETLYAIRRLQAWPGDVYFREPSGIGYWAHVVVNYSKKHRDLTIPITIEVTKVEGGA